jgi:hypothetical protein
MPVASSSLPEVSLPPAVAAVAGKTDALDSAIAIGAALRQMAEQDQRHYALARARAGMAATMTGVYTVVRGFDHLGTKYEPGMLIDREILGDAGVYRFLLARSIRLADPGAASEAA